ncbi:hypothetical protein Tco_1504655 [Tanacetum coccineum]
MDSDFLIEEVDTFLVPEDSIPPGIESDLDSEEDIVFLDNLLNDDPIPEYEHFFLRDEHVCSIDKQLMSIIEDEMFLTMRRSTRASLAFACIVWGNPIS